MSRDTCQPRSGPFYLLIDSTGIKAVGDGEWCRRKHGPSKRRQWRKVHLGVDAGSLEIRAIEVTGSRVGDAPMLPELLEQILPDQAIATVSADGAFDTKGLSRSHCRTRCLCDHPRPQQCKSLAREHTGRCRPQ